MSWLDYAKDLAKKAAAYASPWERVKAREQRRAEKNFEALPRWMRQRKVRQLTRHLGWTARQRLLNQYADHRGFQREQDEREAAKVKPTDPTG